MRNYFYTWIIFLPTCLFGQAARLSGYVTEMNSDKQKVKGVLVGVAASATAHHVLTNTDGSFTLHFQDMQPGQGVVVEAVKKGWVVVNTTEMDVVIPEKYNEQTFVIVMCPFQKLEQTKKEYYKIADLYIERTYKKRLDSIDRKKKGWQQKVEELDKQRAILRAQVTQIAKEYSHTNIDDLTDIEKKAIAFFKAGEIDSSIALRITIGSEKKLKCIVRKRRELDSIMRSYKDSIEKKSGYIMPSFFSNKHPACFLCKGYREMLYIVDAGRKRKINSYEI